MVSAPGFLSFMSGTVFFGPFSGIYVAASSIMLSFC